MKSKIRSIEKYVCLYFCVPVILNLIIESLNRKSLEAGLLYMVEKPLLFAFSTLIIMFTFSLSLFFRRQYFILSSISIVWLIFGVANFIILHFRVTPFSAVDFTLITSAIAVAGHYFSVFNIIMLLLAVIMLLVAIICLFVKTPKNGSLGKEGYFMACSFMIIIVFAIIVIHKSSISVQALTNNYTNISEAYENYGFVYCFTNSIIDTGIKKPQDYSEEEIDKITSKLKNEKNSSKRPNVIMIQLESFFDVYNVNGLRFSKDPLPNFHKLQKNYTSGYLTVPTVGAGTVNTEFEVLTGMSQHDFGVCEYPYKTVLKTETTESICYDLAKLGYTSHCVHDNTATFYGRNTVFSNLGFDSFESIEYMKNITYNKNNWANDSIMADEIIEALDSTDDQDFTFGITVQSHGKYTDITDPDNSHLKVMGMPANESDEYNYYVNQLYEVDEMIGDLVNKLSKRDEDTVLVLYGDHLPSLSLTKSDLKNKNLYQTEYVIWDNMNLKQEDKNVTSYQLYSDTLNKIGIHNGVITKYHQQTDWNSKSYKENLKALEYDSLYGENYVYSGINPFVASDITMGTKKVTVSDVYEDTDSNLYVAGQNFTSYTHIYFNDKEIKTTYISPNKIRIDDIIEFDKDAQQRYKEDTKNNRPNMFKAVVKTEDGVELSETTSLDWDETTYGRSSKTDK